MDLGSLPFSDIGKFTEGGTKGIISNLLAGTTLPVKAAIEQGTGVNTFTGGPVGSAGQYAAGTLSPVNQIYKLLTGKQKLASSQTLNYLTGAGIRDVTPGQQAAELYRQQRPLKKTLRDLKKKKTGG
jgi:hypothetical protein